MSMPDIFDASAHQQAKPSQSDTPKPKSVDPQPVTSESAPPLSSSPDRIVKDVDEYSETMRHETPSNNVFKAFVPKPSKIFFDSQHKEEKVLLLLRRHPITQLPWILISAILLFLPGIFIRLGILDFLPLNFQFAARIGWYLLVLGYVIESYLTWFYNVYIITDERVIDVDFANLIYKNISAAKIQSIEDITNVMQGIASSIFNYGTVKIQTAAAVTEFEFEDVPQPAKVTSFLNEMLIEEEKEKVENRVS